MAKQYKVVVFFPKEGNSKTYTVTADSPEEAKQKAMVQAKQDAPEANAFPKVQNVFEDPNQPPGGDSPPEEGEGGGGGGGGGGATPGLSSVQRPPFEEFFSPEQQMAIYQEGIDRGAAFLKKFAEEPDFFDTVRQQFDQQMSQMGGNFQSILKERQAAFTQPAGPNVFAGDLSNFFQTQLQDAIKSGSGLPRGPFAGTSPTPPKQGT